MRGGRVSISAATLISGWEAVWNVSEPDRYWTFEADTNADIRKVKKNQNTSRISELIFQPICATMLYWTKYLVCFPFFMCQDAINEWTMLLEFIFLSHLKKMIYVNNWIFWSFSEVPMCRGSVFLDFSCGHRSWCSTLHVHTLLHDTDFKLYVSCDQNPWLGKSMVQDSRNVSLCCKMNTILMHIRFCWCLYTGRILKLSIVSAGHLILLWNILNIFYFSSSVVTSVVSKP